MSSRVNRKVIVARLAPCEMLEGSGFRVLEVKTIDVFPDGYSRDAESRGYGAYHMLRAKLEGEARLYRLSWLYRDLGVDSLSSSHSIAPITAR